MNKKSENFNENQFRGGAKIPTVYFVIPCYNEEEVLPVTGPLFMEKLKSLMERGLASSDSSILFVDDGSTDSTSNVLKEFVKQGSEVIFYENNSPPDPHTSTSTTIQVLTLSKNRGHQGALLAGLRYTKGLCNAVISMDSDGQNDLAACDEMIEKYLEGYDAVYAVRTSRETDSFTKRFMANTYYRFMGILGKKMIPGHADYRLISSKVVDILFECPEDEVLLRSFIPSLGLKDIVVPYECHNRIAGTTKYSLSKMLHLAKLGFSKHKK